MVDITSKECVIENKPTILIFADYYLPGFKAGGPINSLQSMCNAMSYENNIYLITRDRDIDESDRYKDIVINKWSEVDNMKIMYKNQNQLSISFIKNIVESINPDVLNLNSLMSVRFSFIPLLASLFFKNFTGKIFLSPRGELSRGALTLKKYQKKIYLNFFKLLGFDKKVHWIASSDGERDDIYRNFRSSQLVIHRVDNLPNYYHWEEELSRSRPKYKNELRLVFFSRISPMKNLTFLLRQLKKITFNVHLSVYGPKEDRNYLNNCLNIVSELPSNISIEFFDELRHNEVYSVLKEYDLFVLPTLGENFGQVIWEALASSLPVLISDRTPWKNLKYKQVGWDISLDNPSEFNFAIEEVYKMNEQQHQCMRSHCRDFAFDYITQSEAIKTLKSLYKK